MMDYFEIDFLKMESKKSGDAIGIRYSVNGVPTIQLVDGGFQNFSDHFIDHIETHYGNPKFIDRVVVTHPDGDHAGGLRNILEHFNVGELWMLRPWLYSNELLPRFLRFQNENNLSDRLKEIYPNIAALEEIAIRKGIPIYEPFQGANIGAFHVMAPSKGRYLNCVVESDKSPEAKKVEAEQNVENLLKGLLEIAENVVRSIAAAWGFEQFSDQETSSENEMSVIQYSNMLEKKILLTGDAGRSALSEAILYAPAIGLELPGLTLLQVPHHGSRRNLSSEILDSLLGEKLLFQPGKGAGTFSAIISASKEDADHPRKTVVRALIHRGANVLTTEEATICHQERGPNRGWGSAVPIDYPEETEEN